MIIEESVLLRNGGQIIEFKQGEIIFEKDTRAKFYWQIISGTVKINTFNLKGKEFFFGLPYDGHSIGESYLFNDKKYPFNATAISNCRIIRMNKAAFLDLTRKTPHLLMNVSIYISERVHFKNIMLPSLGETSSRERLIILLNYIKKFYGQDHNSSFIIPYTRQQLASLTGMTVETIIRTVKNMEKENLLKLNNSKIIY
ncbi:Crp/Fnr family transcriptional regulator [Epilithonimonas sp.]|uniref:Crp/Fnr family transcriptional regulator n=1 Tax=Epilithonimonas sp. TaxID=2894511 RepID=UPI00289DB13C|nr:Crp/Fnr family transcriptional regulator [Epilithonimonas sp.]